MVKNFQAEPPRYGHSVEEVSSIR